MQKVILFLLPLFLGGGCAFANGHTPEQLAKAQEIARDVSPDLYEQYKGTPAEYIVKRFYSLKWERWSVREPDILPQYFKDAVPKLAGFYDDLHKADGWTFPEKITVPRLKTLPVIDGKINKDEWKNARTFHGEYLLDEKSPDPDNTATRWFFGIGENAFYVAFCCQDRDVIPFSVTHETFSGKAPQPVYEGDALEFFVRPDRKKKNYLEVQVNPDGLLWPLHHKLDPFGSWQVTDSKIKKHGIIAATSRTADGYQVEMRIPFALLPEKNLKDFSFMLLRTHRNNAGKNWSSAVCPLLYNAHNVYGFIPANTGE